MKKLYVANFPFQATEDEISDWLINEAQVPVQEFILILDRATCRSRGFGFAELPDEDLLEPTMAKLSGAMFNGRVLKCAEANAKPHALSSTQPRGRE